MDPSSSSQQRRKGGGVGGRGGRGKRNDFQDQVKSNELPPATGSSGGQAVCSCLGTRHDHVTNCMACGYILCQYETQQQQQSARESSLVADTGAVFACPMCHALCTAPLTAQQAQAQGLAESTVKAYQQKDKLLQFDRERTKRTHVHDAQGDYYVSSPWMSQEERREMELKERKRLEMKKLSNTRRKVNIRFDIAGRKIFDALPDDDELDLGTEQPQSQSQSQSQSQRTNVVCKPELDEIDDASYRYGNESLTNSNNTNESSDWSPTLVENSELLLSTSKAAEIYRQMRRSWEESQQTHLITAQSAPGGLAPPAQA